VDSKSRQERTLDIKNEGASGDLYENKQGVEI
jgi:hypothetical protein